jgi:tetratricopeptide (TPR) repeat protein
MSFRQIRQILAALVLVVVLPAGLQAEKDSKKAKELYEQAKRDAGNPSKMVEEMCAAAALDGKYQAECDTVRAAWIKRQDGRLNLAEDALNRKDFKAARELANQVVGVNDEVTGRKNALLVRIDAAERARKAPAAIDHPDRSKELAAKVDADFARGDFLSLASDAQQVTDPSLKADVQRRLNDVARYNSLIAQGQAQEQRGDFVAAKNSYLQAQQVSANGPANVSGHLSEIAGKLARAGSAGKNTANGRGPDNSGLDTAGQVKELLAGARQAENQQQWKLAQERYTAALKLDSANKDAIAGMQRVQPRMAADPLEREKILKAAIRDFYASGFESAQTSLQIYLGEQQVANRGAADFYLGATLLEKWIFQKRGRKPGDAPPAEAVSAFRRARSEGYKPLPEYVSPVVLKVWETAGS